jgi:seryl-tRNA synthetase
MDPRVKNVTQADLEKEFALAMQVREANTELHRAVNEVRELRAQIKQLHTRLEGDPRMKGLLEQADVLDQRMKPVEEELIQVNMKGSEANLAFPNKLNEFFDSFRTAIDAADNAPTEQHYEVFKLLRGQLDQQLAAWRQIMSSDVSAFNAAVKHSDLPVLYLPPGK